MNDNTTGKASLDPLVRNPFSFATWWKAHGRHCARNPEVTPRILAAEAWKASRQNDVRIPNASRQPEPASGDRLDADVGLRIVWRGDAPGTITAVEPRGAGGPLVSVRLDDGSEMHGLTVGEWAPEANAPAQGREAYPAAGCSRKD